MAALQMFRFRTCVGLSRASVVLRANLNENRAFALQRSGYQRFQQSSKRANAFNRRVLILGGLGIVGCVYYVSNLERVPVSGRLRFNNVSVANELEIGKRTFAELLKTYQDKLLPQNDPRVRLVRQVGERIVAAAELQNLDWQFFVVESPMQNAFVIPGGKVFVFTGILPAMQNEDGIAAVLGHEIAHMVARHSAENMSIAQLALLFQIAVAFLFSADFTSLSQIIFNLGFQLPYSRQCESEADYIGLLLMAQACYNPHEAINFWKRMDNSTKQQEKPPALLSTHPANATRLQTIAKWMPEAERKREDTCAQHIHNLTSSFHGYSTAFR